MPQFELLPALGPPGGDATLALSRPFPLGRRLGWLALLFTLEVVCLSIWLDTETLRRATGLMGLVRDWGPYALQSLVVSAAVFLAFSAARSRGSLEHAFRSCNQAIIEWRILSGHLVTLAGSCLLSAWLFSTRATSAGVDVIAAGWLILGALAVAFGICAFLPPAACLGFLHTNPRALIYASLAAVSVNPLAHAAGRFWNPAADLTFRLVRICLQPFAIAVIANPATRVIGTSRFKVTISPQCSGLEGVGLMLLFGLLWLWLYRDELRFPRALLVIPSGLVLLYLLNTVRITALILIGSAGARSVAAGGFHSQAGWIAFNAVALGLLAGFRKVPWLTTARPQEPRTALAENPVAPYLMPFLAILAAAMISRAASGSFEWLYCLRFFAAAAALWVNRRRYAELDWRAGWIAPLAGAAVFAIWLVLHRLSGVGSDSGIVAALRAAPPAAGALWLACRVIAAVTTVPLAEELAFRGFLMRRIDSADFQSVRFQRATLLSIAVSSVAFGVMHGGNWLAGTAAGIIYAAALRRNGRIGDAAAAHAITNALLAAWVLVYKDWSLW